MRKFNRGDAADSGTGTARIRPRRLIQRQVQSTFHVLRSLSYFDDAEDEPDPIALKDQTWESVKLRIAEAVRE